MAVVGIDLGTTNTLVASVQEGRPKVLPVDGQMLLPSVVSFAEDRVLVGYPARNRYVLDPEHTVRSVKRQMGNDEYRVVMGDRTYTAPEISALILQKAVEAASAQLGEPVTEAVITVPAYFGDRARQHTVEAGRLAGLTVKRLLNEPTAAALAYGVKESGAERVLVYDLGGGTLDVSLVEVSEGVIEVRASHGIRHLGGDDFDDRLVNLLLQRLGVDLRHDRQAMARLRDAAEEAKIALSDHPYVTVREEFLARVDGKPVHLEEEISREEFEGLIRDLLESTLEPVRQVLKDARLGKGDLDAVLLVGGSTRIPLVSELLAEELGSEPRRDLHPEQAVALGAALEAAAMEGTVVGAALVDVCAHSLGIQVVDITQDGQIREQVAVLIPRNTAIPTSKSQVFYTLHPDQRDVRIRVYQGESPAPEDNTLLGEFLFEGLSPDPRGGLRQVLVRFDYDLSGMLHVTAQDRRTGRNVKMTVNTAGGEAATAVESGWDETQVQARSRRVIEPLRPAYERLLRLSQAGMSDRVKEALQNLIAEAETLQESDAEAVRAWEEKATDFLFEHEPY